MISTYIVVFSSTVGADPNEAAVVILQAVAKGKADFVVAATSSAKVAPWIRFFLPSVWNKILVDRYEKSRKTTLQKEALMNLKKIS